MRPFIINFLTAKRGLSKNIQIIARSVVTGGCVSKFHSQMTNIPFLLKFAKNSNIFAQFASKVEKCIKTMLSLFDLKKIKSCLSLP